MIGAWFQINKNPCKECIVKAMCKCNDICCDIYRPYDIKKVEKADCIKSILLTTLMLIVNAIGVILFLR